MRNVLINDKSIKELKDNHKELWLTALSIITLNMDIRICKQKSLIKLGINQGYWPEDECFLCEIDNRRVRRKGWSNCACCPIKNWNLLSIKPSTHHCTSPYSTYTKISNIKPLQTKKKYIKLIANTELR